MSDIYVDEYGFKPLTPRLQKALYLLLDHACQENWPAVDNYLEVIYPAHFDAVIDLGTFEELKDLGYVGIDATHWGDRATGGMPYKALFYKEELEAYNNRKRDWENQEALKEKKAKRFQILLSILGIIGALLGAIIGAWATLRAVGVIQFPF